MNGKTWHHVSPVTGLGICQAQSPDKCRFGADNHFNAKAAERIKTGRTSNYQEYEAMREHQLATGQKVAEKKLPPAEPAVVTPVVTPAAMPKSRPPAPAAPVKRSNGFPTNHQRPRIGDEILYHTEIGFPKNFVPPKGRYELEWGTHALDEAAKDRYGKVPTPKTLVVDKMKIIELGVKNGKVSKILYRGTLACAICRENETPQANCTHPKRDMCIVVIPKPNKQPWYVKTVWINLQSDKHKTLDGSKYQKPE
jgi:hypothetical protein